VWWLARGSGFDFEGGAGGGEVGSIVGPFIRGEENIVEKQSKAPDCWWTHKKKAIDWKYAFYGSTEIQKYLVWYFIS